MDEKEFKKEFEKTKNYVVGFAKKNNFTLNPDSAVVDMIIEGLLRNKLKYGKQYCPCRLLSGKTQEDLPKICPCKWHREEIARDGHCHCVLFFKSEKMENK